jgi:hypothetical protein
VWPKVACAGVANIADVASAARMTVERFMVWPPLKAVRMVHAILRNCRAKREILRGTLVNEGFERPDL